MGRYNAKKNLGITMKGAALFLFMVLYASPGKTDARGAAWGPEDAALLKKLAAITKPADRARVAAANRSIITEEWLYSAASSSSALGSNYTDDTGLRMTRTVEELARGRNLKGCQGAALYARGDILLDFRYRYREAEEAYAGALALFREK
ncbi:MAG TPA: hypothetical protein PKN50_20600, partial [Spirochaetota bacterium]|nr:hypothetical protein [Spirochaetota bacterium]